MRRPFPHAPLVVGLLAIVVGVSPAQNQIQYRPTPGGVPPPQTQSYARPTGATVVAAPTYVPAPTYGYPGYPTIQGPVAGRPNGPANATRPYGKSRKAVNPAR